MSPAVSPSTSTPGATWSDQKIHGAGRNSNSPDAWLKTLLPVTSPGRRSGVHCRRRKAPPNDFASDFAITVLAVPGTSSMST